MHVTLQTKQNHQTNDRGIIVQPMGSKRTSRLLHATSTSLSIQFKGFKQQDANDFLVNFINAINDCLKK